MQRLSSRPLVLLAALALFAPSATATWFAYGSHEPDNGLDSDSLMFFDPPGAATDRIYFNVVTGMSSGLRGIMVSPNVGLIETRTEIPTSETHQALFGVWADCNGDGYIGIAEGAQREYPSELLASGAVCPAFTGPTTAWTSGAHNYNGWVSELIPITGIPVGISTNTTDLRRYDDAAAMVWGDYNLPTTVTVSGGGSCPIAPQPRGTWQSTGGAINYVDCLGGAFGPMDVVNSVFNGRRLLAQNAPGLRDLGVDDNGLAFDNPNDARGTIYDHPNPLGSEDSSGAIVFIADCSEDAEPTFHSGDFFNQTPLGPSVPAGFQNDTIGAVDPRVESGTPTVAGQVNQTNEELLEDCDTSNDPGHDTYGNTVFYVGEADVAPVVAANKRAANFNFQLQFWGRGGDTFGFLEIFDLGTGDVAYGGPAGAPTPGAPMTNWNNGASTTKTPGAVRADIAEGTVQFPSAYYLTFYAHTGAETAARGFVAPGGSGVYGSTQCGDHDSGIHNGWNCDVSQWYLDANGVPSPEVTPRARPGQIYEHRDIDCFDGSIGETGLAIGTAALGPNGCIPTSS